MSVNHPLRRPSAPDTHRRKLFLRFQLGGERYVLAASDIESVLALAPMRRIASAPDWVTGVLPYRGNPVPVIDLSLRTIGVAAHAVTSTRLVMVYFRFRENGEPHIAATGETTRLLGLIIEHVNETVHLDATAFVAPGIQTPQARYLGPVLKEAEGYVQWLRVEDLLDPALRVALFAASDTEAGV